MANPWLDFVKEFRKKLPKDTPYKDVLKKAKVEYAKTKKDKPKSKPKAGTKGAKSKTRKGDLDFTTKKGDKDFHRDDKDIKEKRDPFRDTSFLQESARQLMADEAAKKGRAKAELEKKFLEAGGTKEELKRELIKKQAVDLHSLVGGSLLGGDPNTFSPMGGALNSTKDERAKLVRKYAKAKSLVMEFLRKGQLNQKEFNNFRALTRILSKSKSDKYAKDFAKVRKEFNTKKYQKLVEKKMDEKSVRDSKKLDTQLGQVMKILEGIRAARPLFSETAFEKGKKVEATAPLDITKKVEKQEKVKKGALLANKVAHKRDTITLNAQGDLRERPKQAIDEFTRQFGLDPLSYDGFLNKLPKSPQELLELQRNLTYLTRIPEDLLSQNRAIRDKLANQILQVQDDLLSYAREEPPTETGVQISKDGQSIILFSKTKSGQQKIQVVKLGQDAQPHYLDMSHMFNDKAKVARHRLDSKTEAVTDLPEEYITLAMTNLGYDDDFSELGQVDREEIISEAESLYQQDRLSKQAEDDKRTLDALGIDTAKPRTARADLSMKATLSRGYDLISNQDKIRREGHKVNPELISFFNNEVKNPNASIGEVVAWLLEHTTGQESEGFINANNQFVSFTYQDQRYLLNQLKQPQYADALDDVDAGSLPTGQEVRQASALASVQQAAERLAEAEAAAQQQAGQPAQPIDNVSYLGALTQLLFLTDRYFSDPLAVSKLTTSRKSRGISQLTRGLRNILLGLPDFQQDDYNLIGRLFSDMGVPTAEYQPIIATLQAYPDQQNRPNLRDQFTMDVLAKLQVGKSQLLNKAQRIKADALGLPEPSQSAEGAIAYLNPQEHNDLLVYQRALTDPSQAGQLQVLRQKYAGNAKMEDEFTDADEANASGAAPAKDLLPAQVTQVTQDVGGEPQPNIQLTIGDTTPATPPSQPATPPAQPATPAASGDDEVARLIAAGNTEGAKLVAKYNQMFPNDPAQAAAQSAPPAAQPVVTAATSQPTPPPQIEHSSTSESEEEEPAPVAPKQPTYKKFPSPISNVAVAEATAQSIYVQSSGAKDSLREYYLGREFPDVLIDTLVAEFAIDTAVIQPVNYMIVGEDRAKQDNLPPITQELYNSWLGNVLLYNQYTNRNKEYKREVKAFDKKQAAAQSAPAAPVSQASAPVASASQEKRFNRIWNAYEQQKETMDTVENGTTTLNKIKGLAHDNKDLMETINGQIAELEHVHSLEAIRHDDWSVEASNKSQIISDDNLKRLAIIYNALRDGNLIVNGKNLNMGDLGEQMSQSKDTLELQKQVMRLLRPADNISQAVLFPFLNFVLGIQNVTTLPRNRFKSPVDLDAVLGLKFVDKLPEDDQAAINRILAVMTKYRANFKQRMKEIQKGELAYYQSVKRHMLGYKDDLRKAYPALFGANASEGDLTGAGFGDFLGKMKKKAMDMYNSAKNRVTQEIGDASKLGHQIASGVQTYYGNKVNTVGNVQPEDQVYANMANNVYETQRKSFGDFQYVPNISSPTMAVWMNQNNKTIDIAFRGTANLHDVGTDTQLAVGNLAQTPRFQQDLQMVQKVKNEFPNYTINYTGHSLGGTIASLMKKTVGGGKAVVFNAGYGVNMGNLKGNNITSYQTEGDAVSMLGTGRYDTNYMIKNPHLDGNSSALNAHSMSNFNPSGGDLTSGLNKAFQPIFLGGNLGADPATYTPKQFSSGGAIDASQGGKSTNECKSMFMEGDISGGSLSHSLMKTRLREIDNLIEHFQDTNSRAEYIKLKGNIPIRLKEAHNALQTGSQSDYREYGKILRELGNDYNKVVRGREHLFLGVSIQQKSLKHQLPVEKSHGIDFSKVHPQIRDKLARGGKLSLQEHEHIKRMTGHYINEVGGGMGSFWQSPAGANAVSINLSGRDLTGQKVGGAFGSMDDNISGFKQMIGQQSGNPLDYLPY